MATNKRFTVATALAGLVVVARHLIITRNKPRAPRAPSDEFGLDCPVDRTNRCVLSVLGDSMGNARTCAPISCRCSVKWDFRPPGVVFLFLILHCMFFVVGRGRVQRRLLYVECLPLWVADMDFPVCPSIRAAIAARASHPTFGYTYQPEEAWCVVWWWW